MGLYIPPRIVRDLSVSIERDTFERFSLGGPSRLVGGPERSSAALSLNAEDVIDFADLFEAVGHSGQRIAVVSSQGFIRDRLLHFQEIVGHIQRMEQSHSPHDFGMSFHLDIIGESARIVMDENPIETLTRYFNDGEFACPFMFPGILTIPPRMQVRMHSAANGDIGYVQNLSADQYLAFSKNSLNPFAIGICHKSINAFGVLTRTGVDAEQYIGVFFKKVFFSRSEWPSWISTARTGTAAPMENLSFSIVPVQDGESSSVNVNTRNAPPRRFLTLKD